MVSHTSSYELVNYRPEHRAQVLKLQKHHLSDDEAVSDAYLQWKYDRNPYLKGDNIYVAFEREQAVGMVGVYGTKWHCGDPEQCFVLPCFSDAVIHPEWRNSGLFPELNRFALADLAATTDHTYALDMSAMSNIAASLMMQGWRTPGFIQTAHWRATRHNRSEPIRAWAKKTIPMARPLYGRLRSTLRRKKADAETLPLPTFSQLDSLNGENGSPDSDGRIFSRQNALPVEMAGLVTRIGFADRLQHVRDKHYFQWRFENPLSSYRYIFHRDTQINGYLVLQTSRWVGGGANVVDWAASDQSILEALLTFATQKTTLSGLNIWSATLSESIRNVLLRTGFTLKEGSGNLSQDLQRPTMLIKGIHELTVQQSWEIENKALLALSNWELYMANSDNY